jgi:hypothetical protein
MKPRIIISDWKTNFFDDIRKSGVYQRMYKPLENDFECLTYFEVKEIPEEVLEDRIDSIVIHPGVKLDDIHLLQRFEDIPKFVVSGYPEIMKEGYEWAELKNTQYIRYNPFTIKKRLQKILIPNQNK